MSIVPNEDLYKRQKQSTRLLFYLIDTYYAIKATTITFPLMSNDDDDSPLDDPLLQNKNDNSEENDVESDGTLSEPMPSSVSFDGMVINSRYWDNARGFWDVDSKDICDRMVTSLVFWNTPGNTTLRPKADFFGPFWIATLLAFFVALTPDLTSFKYWNVQGAENFQNYMCQLLWAMTILYTFTFGVPYLLGLTIAGRCTTSQQQEQSFEQQASTADLVCLYGYSLVWFFPAVVICRVLAYFVAPNNLFLLAMIIVAVPSGISGIFIYQHVKERLSEHTWRQRFLVAMVFCQYVFFSHFQYSCFGLGRAGNVSLEEFDFYVLAMTYQPDFCSSRIYCSNQKEGFTIHGLWPEWYNGTWPSTCSKNRRATLEKQVLQTVGEARLDRYWPNAKVGLGNPGDTDLWDHEWNKHGTCSGLSSRGYLEATLGSFVSTPTNVQQHFGRNIGRESLLSAFGGNDKVVAICNSNFVSEIRVCLGRNAAGIPTRRIKCPSFVLDQGNCINDDVTLRSSQETRKPTSEYYLRLM